MADTFRIRRGEATISGAAPNPITLTANDAAIDISGCTVSAKRRAGASAVNTTDETLTTAGGGVVVVDATTGKVALVMAGAATALYALGQHFWQFVVTFPSGRIVRIPVGMFVEEGLP